jgi:peroxiredoxin Q/BCP
MPAAGHPAPDFTLPRDGGGEVTLSSFRPGKVVLYFYPKDDTPGCTREACAFEAQSPELKGAVVLGVSADSAASHAKFKAKYGLNFTLLVDSGNKLSTTYGVFREKVMYGKKVTGVVRSTFLIDGEGRLRQIWDGVKVDGHVDKVAAAVAAL